ncbi:NUDIX domain-containing protein [bacterium]|nr:NUDIX domain-containing protein [bacterium]
MDDVVVVNENDEVVGTMPRAEAHRDGTPHRIVAVYVENLKGEILVQVRMTERLDHSSAGHVNPGETYLAAAIRELDEELGIRNVTLTLLGNTISREVRDGGENRTHVFQIFSCIAEPTVLQEDEVKGVYWANPQDVLLEMEKNPEDLKFTGGFRASLPVYLANKINKL